MPISKRKVSIKFGMVTTAIAGVAVYLNENRPRQAGVAAGNEELSAMMIGLRDGERFVPSSIVVDLCTAPGVGQTATYRLRRGSPRNAPDILANNGATLVISGTATTGRGGTGGATSYGPMDRMTLGVTGSGGAAAHQTTCRVEGYIIGRGK